MSRATRSNASLHYSDLDDLRALTTKAKALMMTDVPRPDLTDAAFVLGSASSRAFLICWPSA